MSDAYPSRELTEDALDEEIHLLGHVVLTASSMTRHLTQDEVDETLGVPAVPSRRRPAGIRRRRADREPGSSADGEAQRAPV